MGEGREGERGEEREGDRWKSGRESEIERQTDRQRVCVRWERD